MQAVLALSPDEDRGMAPCGSAFVAESHFDVVPSLGNRPRGDFQETPICEKGIVLCLAHVGTLHVQLHHQPYKLWRASSWEYLCASPGSY